VRLVEADEVDEDFGCCCTTSDGVELEERHADDSCPVFAKAQKELPKFGRNLSVKSLLSCLVKTNVFSNKSLCSLEAGFLKQLGAR
jgi:hypothetical protein